MALGGGISWRWSRSGPVVDHDHAAEAGLVGSIGTWAKARPQRPAQILCLGGWRVFPAQTERKTMRSEHNAQISAGQAKGRLHAIWQAETKVKCHTLQGGMAVS